MLMSSSSSTQRGAATTSSTIDRILKQRGTIVHPTSVELTKLTLLFTLHGVVWFHLVYPKEFPRSFIRVLETLCVFWQ